MGSDHDVGVARIGPLRHPSAFLEILQQGGDHAVDALRREQRKHAVLRAESVPDRVSGITLAAVNAIVERAVVVTVFRKHARIQQRVIQRRVKQRLVIIGGAVDLQADQLLVPLRAQLLLHVREIPPGNLPPEICARLVDADE